MVIDRGSHLPLYIQLKEQILDDINRGVWKPGDKLPTEEEIQKDYDLSRTTVRQALRELELEDRIERQAGRGTFVAQHKIQEGTQAFNLDVSDNKNPSLELVYKVLSYQRASAPEAVARRMGVPVNTPLFRLERLRLANQEVIGYIVTYIAERYSGQVDLNLADKGGTMNYLTPIGLDGCMTERMVEALAADREAARILNIDRSTPVLVLTRLLRSPQGAPIEYFRGVYRGDRFSYHIQDLPPQV